MLMGKGKLLREAVERLVRALDNGAEVTPRMRAQAGVEGRVLEDLRVNNGRGVTNDMLRDADPFIIDEFYDIPLDQASRMRRADEMFPETAYHYTGPNYRDNIESVDFQWVRPELGDGFHMGTPEAAEDMFDFMHMKDVDGVMLTPEEVMRRHNVGEDPAVPGPRTMRMRYDPGNQVHYGMDLGNFTDPEAMSVMLDKYPDAAPFMPDPDYEFRDLVKAASDGYHDQLYRLTEDDIAQHYLQRVGIHAPAVERTAQTGQAVDEGGAIAQWAVDNGFMTDESLAAEGERLLKLRRDEAVLDAYREFGIDSASYPNDHEGLPGTESVMIINPEQVRSVNARFDPRLRHLKHLMASGSGAAVLPYATPDER